MQQKSDVADNIMVFDYLHLLLHVSISITATIVIVITVVIIIIIVTMGFSSESSFYIIYYFQVSTYETQSSPTEEDELVQARQELAVIQRESATYWELELEDTDPRNRQKRAIKNFESYGAKWTTHIYYGIDEELYKESE